MGLLQAGQACLLGLLILSSLTTGRNQRNHILGVCDASQPFTKMFPTSLEKKCYRKLDAILASTCFQGQILRLQFPVKREKGMNSCWKMRIGCAYGQIEHATWTTINTCASIHATRHWKISVFGWLRTPTCTIHTYLTFHVGLAFGTAWLLMPCGSELNFCTSCNYRSRCLQT